MIPIPLLEELINRSIARDPQATMAMSELADAVIALEITIPTRSFYLSLLSGGVYISTHINGTVPNAVVKGTPLEIICMLKSDVAKKQPAMDGDTKLVMRFCSILRSLEIDWETHLSDLLGDVTAHRLVCLAHGAGEWASHIRATILDEGHEIIQTNCRLVPQTNDIADFTTAVKELQDDMEALEKRVGRLPPTKVN